MPWYGKYEEEETQIERIERTLKEIKRKEIEKMVDISLTSRYLNKE
jgi:hypothetical protein